MHCYLMYLRLIALINSLILFLKLIKVSLARFLKHFWRVVNDLEAARANFLPRHKGALQKTLSNLSIYC